MAGNHPTILELRSSGLHRRCSCLLSHLSNQNLDFPFTCLSFTGTWDSTRSEQKLSSRKKKFLKEYKLYGKKETKNVGFNGKHLFSNDFFGKGSLGGRMERPPGVLLTGMTNTRQGFLLF